MKRKGYLSEKRNVLTLLSILLIAWWCVIGVRFGVNLYRISRIEAQRIETDRIYNAYNQSENLMRNGTDTLTDSARQYAFSGERRHLDNYFTEVNETRSREQALELLKTVDDTPNISTLLESAMEQSTALMDVEFHAMRLRAEAAHTELSLLPEAVSGYSLPASERLLSNTEKINRALDLLLDDNYTELKEKIWGTTESFLEEALVKTTADRDRHTVDIDNDLREQRVLFVFFGIGILYIIYFTLSHLRLHKTNTDALRREVEKQSGMIRDAYDRQSKLQESIVDGMAKLVEGRDIRTGAHVKNTRTYVTMIVNKLEEQGVLTGEESRQYAEQIIRASVLHDVGKIFISDFLLNKPGKLTQDEFNMMKEHTVLGGEIVDDLFCDNLDPETIAVIRDIVVHHHEKWDGSGYPDKLRGEEIPLAARIMAVADVFDALASKRPYKDPMSVDQALAILEHDKGAHFDPVIVDAFVSMREELTAFVDACHANDEDGAVQSIFRKFEEKVQQEAIISGLSNDYEVIFYVKPAENRISMLRFSAALAAKLEDRRIFTHDFDLETFHSVTDGFVFADDQPLCRSVLSADGIRSHLENSFVRIFLIRLMRDGEPVYYQAKLIRLGKEQDSNFDILLGLTDVDEDTHRRMNEALELEEAKKQAESANAAKTEFVLEASRNLRTVVSNIVGYTNMLDKHFDEPLKSRDYLNRVEKSEAELTKILNVTLDMETIEKGEKQ